MKKKAKFTILRITLIDGKAIEKSKKKKKKKKLEAL